MINFNYEVDFKLEHETLYSDWISKVIRSEKKNEGEINYIFCDDDYLVEINQQYLDHDTLTEIIRFDYSIGKDLHGDVYISIERVRENAVDFNVDFEEELKRVIVHGILHYCGYKDKNEEDENRMRQKEDEKMEMFHVKHN